MSFPQNERVKSTPIPSFEEERGIFNLGGLLN
jgi:hypothetical protein